MRREIVGNQYKDVTSEEIGADVPNRKMDFPFGLLNR
jgi:hypothetical protein